MPSPIKIETFYNRMTGCYYFKERETYIKNCTLLFNGILKKYKNSNKTFLEVFADNFNSKTYSGKSIIYIEDREIFKEYCLSCASHLNNFLDQNKIDKFLERFVYKDKIFGYIDGIIYKDNITVQLSYKNSINTQKSIDFYVLNNYIYNVVNNTNYNTVVMSVPTDTYFQVNYEKNDYTIKRGYIKSILTSKMRRKGLHCLNCNKQCKPAFINNLTRLEQNK